MGSDTEEKLLLRKGLFQQEGRALVSRRNSFSLADEPLLDLLFSFSLLKYTGCVVSLWAT